MAYWINTVSRDHVLRGVAGGFTQANHGKPTGMRRLLRGDEIAFYSPKTDYPNGAALQEFTALGIVTDDVPYQVEVTPDFQPYRRNVAFAECRPAPIRPLIDALEFIEDKRRWGYRFRFGLFSISAHDFDVVRTAMLAPEENG